MEVGVLWLSDSGDKPGEVIFWTYDSNARYWMRIGDHGLLFCDSDRDNKSEIPTERDPRHEYNIIGVDII